MAVDDTRVFFMHRPKQNYQLSSVPKAGGETKNLSQWVQTCWLAADAERLYCAETAGNMMVIDKLTGASKSIVDYTNVPFLPANLSAVSIDDTSVYFAGTMLLLKMAKSDEIVYQVVDGIVNVQRLAHDTTHLYWTTPGWPTALGSVSKEGGEPVWFGEDVEAGTRTLAVHDTDVYWSNDIEGTIKRVPKGGGATTVVASGQGRPVAMVADASGVYWANQSDGRVMRFVP